MAPPFKTAEFDIMYGEGISKEGDILDLAANIDIVNKSGAWYSYGDLRLGQGRENAKNYLKDDEIDMLNRLTVLFLDSAELRVKERKDLTLNYWRNNVDLLLNFQNKDVLKDAGSISNVQMEQIVDAVYEEFNNRRKLYAIEQANKEEKEDLFAVEKLLKQRKTKNYQ